MAKWADDAMKPMNSGSRETTLSILHNQIKENNDQINNIGHRLDALTTRLLGINPAAISEDIVQHNDGLCGELLSSVQYQTNRLSDLLDFIARLEDL